MHLQIGLVAKMTLGLNEMVKRNYILQNGPIILVKIEKLYTS